jgi:hypothetical protein
VVVPPGSEGVDGGFVVGDGAGFVVPGAGVVVPGAGVVVPGAGVVVPGWLLVGAGAEAGGFVPLPDESKPPAGAAPPPFPPWASQTAQPSPAGAAIGCRASATRTSAAIGAAGSVACAVAGCMSII